MAWYKFFLPIFFRLTPLVNVLDGCKTTLKNIDKSIIQNKTMTHRTICILLEILYFLKFTAEGKLTVIITVIGFWFTKLSNCRLSKQAWNHYPYQWYSTLIRADFVRKPRYLHCLPFLKTEMAEVVGLFPHGRRDSLCIVNTMSSAVIILLQVFLNVLVNAQDE